MMHVELQATCSALGYLEGHKYVKEPDCLETVKDLIRFLKREDETCDIRRQLGHAQIVQNDLLPLVKQHHTDRSLFEILVRLLVNLTQPAIICFKNFIPTDKTLRNFYLEVESDLQEYKEVFVDEDFFSTLTERIGELLKLDWEHRQEEDRLLIERILILIRNILHVPPNQDQEQRTDDDATIHDQVIWAIHCSGLEDLLLYIASSEDERQFSMHVLEIVSLLFREQTPEVLACAGVKHSQSQKEKEERELESLRELERTQKASLQMKLSTRHSRFGGTYVVKNMKSISERDVIFHKAQHDVSNLTFDVNKKPKKIAKNRQPIKDKDLVRRSTLSIRLGLKEFCVQFLENCYNPLMYAVKDILNHERTQEHDETYYLWAIRFFMEFCRHHSGQVELVSETMSVQAFHYIQVQMMQYYEMQMMEKKEAIVWGKRVHLALKAYQELLFTLDSMDRSKNPQLMESSKVLKSNIFYMMEFRDIFLTLLRKFNQSQQSRTHLRDLVETTHLFLKMLENETKKNSHLVVQSKKKKKKLPKKKNVAKENKDPQELGPQQLEDMWDELSPDLSSLFQGRGEIPTDVSPFDAASEIEEEQQRINAMVSIQSTLRNAEGGTAIALLRAAREIWPERNEFGSRDISPEEEFMALREIFMAALPAVNAPENAVEEENQEGVEEGAEVEEEEEMSSFAVSEQEFNFKEFVHKFTKCDILKCYVLLLTDFQKNSTHTNHCVIKMLHRISVDLGNLGMLYQASLFRVFQRILLSPLAKLERYKEISKFAFFIIRNFVETAEKNPKAIMELLFWKSNKDATELVDGYGTYQSKGKVLWTEDQEMEVRHLFDEYRDQEDASKDVLDCIMDRITDPSKSRGQVLRELKKQGLIGSAKELKRGKKGGSRPGPWTEEEEFDLANLYDRFKSTNDPLGSIIANMEVKRGKSKVIEKLFSLDLVKDRKELYKRRQKRGRQGSDSDDDDVVRQNEEFRELPSDYEDPGSSSSDEDNNTVSDNDLEKEGEGQSRDVGDAEDMAAIITTLVQNGYKDQIQWIQRGLGRTAGDKEESDSDMAVPIVPLTEENETAMDDDRFLSFLRKIGISPPASEQEVFWRIPGEWKPAQLRSLVEGLTVDDNGVPTHAHTITVHQPNNSQKGKNEKKKKVEKKKLEKKTSERMEKLKAMAKKRTENKENKPRRDRSRKRVVSSAVVEDDHDDDMEVDQEGQDHRSGSDSEIENTSQPSITSRVKPAARKRSRIVKRLKDSDSEDSDEDVGATVDEAQGTVLQDQSDEESSQTQKRPLDFGDSSSDDDEPLQPAKRARIPSSDSDAPAQPLNDAQSDTGSDDDEPLQPAKRNRIPSSDSNTPAAPPLNDPDAHSDTGSDDVEPLKLGKRAQIASSDTPAQPDADIQSDTGSDDDDEPLNPAKRARIASTDTPAQPANDADTQSDTGSDDDDEPLKPAKRARIASTDTPAQPASDADTQSDTGSDDDDEPLLAKAKQASFQPTQFSLAMGDDSDSDLDDHVPLRQVLKRNNRIESDDDE